MTEHNFTTDAHDQHPEMGQCCNFASRRLYGECKVCGRSASNPPDETKLTVQSNHANEYQAWTRTTATYPDVGTGSPLALLYTTLGISDEAGEIAGKTKKALRGDNGPSGYEGLRALRGSDGILSELGDVIWYVARCADEHGFRLSQIFEHNREKLESRKARGVIKGSGDNR